MGMLNHMQTPFCRSILLKMINVSFMQSIIHVSVELELLAQGTIPLPTTSALATPINMPGGMLMLFHWPPHYSKQ
jgi:hypothetical protein